LRWRNKAGQHSKHNPKQQKEKQQMNTQTPDKRTLYKTAQATIGCAHFKKDDFVSVEYYGIGSGGVHYFSCWIPSNNAGVAVYPEHHLTRFGL